RQLHADHRRLARPQRDAGGGGVREAGLAHGHLVEARERERGQRGGAARVGGGRAAHSRRGIGERDRGLRHHGPLRVLDDHHQGRRVGGLRAGGEGGGQEGGDDEGSQGRAHGQDLLSTSG